MDVSEPAVALAGGLTMPLLRALAQRSSPATAGQLRRTAAAGSEAGVRRALDRLARHGLLTADEVGNQTVYTLNREHVLYPAVTALLRPEDELVGRLRQEIAAWHVPPVLAALYGSAARRDGDADSDIDILLIRPARLSPSHDEMWVDQVHQLRGLVLRWTGNRCQVTDRSLASLRQLSRAHEPIVDEWRRDAIGLGGADIVQLAGRL